MQTINRREAVKRVSMAMGGTIAGPTILGLMQGCVAEPGIDWEPVFFSEEQARLITIIADIILPETNTPAASALGVPKFVEDMVSKVMEEDSRTLFNEKMTAFDQESIEKYGKSFVNMGPDDQKTFVVDKHAEIEGKSNLFGKDRPFIWLIKELTIAGYFTTEVGCTQVLQYVQIPAEFKSCISVEEAGGRTWAT